MNIKTALKSEILNEFLNLDYLNYETLTEVKKAFAKNSPNSIKLETLI